MSSTINLPGGSLLRPKVAGVKRAMRVSASSPIYRGEMVERTHEYIPLTEYLRWGVEDVHILDAAELSDGRVGVVFAQAGQTKFKILSYDGETLALGNTLILVEDEALEAARVIELEAGRAMVVYNQDAAGMAAVVTVKDRTATLAYTDILEDRGDPSNLTVCGLESGQVLLGWMKTNGEYWLKVVTPRAGQVQLGNLECRVDVNNDVDVYDSGWSLIRVSGKTAVLAGPQALDRPVVFAVIDVADGAPTVRCTGEGKWGCALPSIQAVPLSGGRWLMAYGVAWLSPDKQVNKSTLAYEIWGLTRYAAELCSYGCEDTRYAASIGAVGVSSNGMGVAISYTGEGEGRVALLATRDSPHAGPTVPLGSHDGFSRVIPISNALAFHVAQIDGGGFARVMGVSQVAVPTVSRAHGVALSGGNPGETITVQFPDNLADG